MVKASLLLPFVGTTASLDMNKNIQIHARVPYISAITWTSPDGSYGLGDILTCAVTFTAAVVVSGTPSLELETGSVKRHAYYSSGSGSNTLEFQYVTELGDTSLDLDYTSVSALVLEEEATIRTKPNVGSSPIQNVMTMLNPPGAQLSGEQRLVFSNGRAVFRDLVVPTLGVGYRMDFTTLTDLHVSATFNVLYSPEYAIRSKPFSSGMKLGYSVDISGDSVIMGAPGEHKVFDEIQTITTTGTSAALVTEVQVITTRDIHQVEIQVYTI